MRMCWLFLLIFVVRISIAAQAPADGLFSGEQASQFEDILASSPSAATKQYLHMETLWEMDMSKVANGDAANDAFENNHNLFVVDGTVYVYVEKYQSSGAYVLIRKISAADGKYIGAQSLSFKDELSNTSLLKMMTADDAGNLALIGITANPLPQSPMKLFLQIYDKQLEFIKSIPPYEETANYDCNHLRGDFEWLGMNGNLLSGNFDFSIGCWHFWGDASQSNGEFTPSKCTFKFSDGQIPLIETTKYSSGDYYTIETRDYSVGNHRCNGMLYTCSISDDIEIIQTFGTKDNFDTHSPLLLYKNKTFTGDFSYMEQVAQMNNPTLKWMDKYCFGVFPVKVGDEHLLILPHSFNKEDGITFKVAQWKDITTFNKLSELWQFPSQNKFPADTEYLFQSESDGAYKHIYEFARPKVVVVPGSGNGTSPQNEEGNLSPTEATIYAYMPGSLLGAYKISLIDDPIASGVVVSSETKGTTVDYSLDGDQLRLSSDIDNVEVRIYSTGGACIYSTEMTSPGQSINLDNLPSGIYILTLNGEPHKIVLQ